MSAMEADLETEVEYPAPPNIVENTLPDMVKNKPPDIEKNMPPDSPEKRTSVITPPKVNPTATPEEDIITVPISILCAKGPVAHQTTQGAVALGNQGTFLLSAEPNATVTKKTPQSVLTIKVEPDDEAQDDTSIDGDNYWNPEHSIKQEIEEVQVVDENSSDSSGCDSPESPRSIELYCPSNSEDFDMIQEEGSVDPLACDIKLEHVVKLEPGIDQGMDTSEWSNDKTSESNEAEKHSEDSAKERESAKTQTKIPWNQVKYECPKCQKVCKAPGPYMRHMKTHSETACYKCMICPYGTDSLPFFAHHMSNRHPGEKPFSCQFCDYRTIDKYRFGKHSLKHLRKCPPEKSPERLDMETHSRNEINDQTTLDTDYEKHLSEQSEPFKCEHCSFSSFYKGNLKKHLLSKHSAKKTVNQMKTLGLSDTPLSILRKTCVNKSAVKSPNCKTCPHCNYSTPYQSVLLRHMIKHSMKKPYKCHVCLFSSHSNHGLICHMMKMHPGEKVVTEQSIHSEKRLYKCDVCSFSTSSDYGLIVHTKKMHRRKNLVTDRSSGSSQENSLDKLYHCGECSYSSDRFKFLKKHIDLKHSTEEHVTKPSNNLEQSVDEMPSSSVEIDDSCQATETKPADNDSSQSGKAMKGTNMKKYCVKGFFSCPECSYRTLRGWFLARHLSTHAGQTISKCPLCPFTSEWNHGIKIHMKTIHSEKKTGTNRLKLIHKYKGTGKKPYACSLCDFSTITKFRLDQHMVKHSSLKAYKCKLCSAEFRWKHHLQWHMNCKHPQQKEVDFEDVKDVKGDTGQPDIQKDSVKNIFACSHCKFRTHKERSLKKHVSMQHRNQRCYKCQKCSFTSVSILGIKVHSQWKHDNKRHSQNYSLKTEEASEAVEDVKDASEQLENYDSDIHNHSMEKTDIQNHSVENVTEIQNPSVKNIFACSDCKFRTHKAWVLKRHRSMRHRNQRCYKCQKCSFTSVSILGIKVHSQWKHDNKRHSQNYSLKTEEASKAVEDVKDASEQLENYDSDIHNHSMEKTDIQNHSVENVTDIQNPSVKNIFACSHCKFRTHKAWVLKRHRSMRHRNEIRYKCSICSFTSQSIPGLRIHKVRKHNISNVSNSETVFSESVKNCTDGSKSSAVNRGVIPNIDKESHGNTQDNEFESISVDNSSALHTPDNDDTNSHKKFRQFDCSQCAFRSDKRRSLETHLLVHSSEVSYQCANCSFQSLTKHGIRIHSMWSHSENVRLSTESSELSNTNSNPNHSLSSLTQQSLDQYLVKHSSDSHMSSKHLDKEVLPKPTDDSSPVHEGKLKLAESLHNYESSKAQSQKTDTNKDSTSKTLACSVCPFLTHNKRFLKRHFIIQHPTLDSSKRFLMKCPKCPFTSKWNHSIKVHLKSKHSKKNVASHQMKATGISKTNRTNLYNCPHCNFETPFKTKLAKHLNKHSGNYHKCQLCRYGSKWEHNLKRHMACKHSDKKVVPEPLNDSRSPIKSGQMSVSALLNDEYSLDLIESRAGSSKNEVYSESLKNTEQSFSVHQSSASSKNEVVFESLKNTEQSSIEHQMSVVAMDVNTNTKKVLLCFHCDFKTEIKVDFTRHLLTHVNSMSC